MRYSHTKVHLINKHNITALGYDEVMDQTLGLTLKEICERTVRKKEAQNKAITKKISLQISSLIFAVVFSQKIGIRCFFSCCSVGKMSVHWCCCCCAKNNFSLLFSSQIYV